MSFVFRAFLLGDFRTRRPRRLSEPLDLRQRSRLWTPGRWLPQPLVRNAGAGASILGTAMRQNTHTTNRPGYKFGSATC